MKNSIQIEQFGKRLKQLRKNAELTQDTLAYEAGIDRKTLRNIEKGQAVVLLDTIISLARALNIDPASFFEGMEMDYEY